MQLQRIEIDWEIHRAIEAERRGFDEPPYMALRRLLGLPSGDQQNAAGAATGRPWTEDGVVVPSGSLARMTYQRGTQVYEGQFIDGQLVVQGQRFDSLSSAASALGKTKEGKSTLLNGWLYWEAKFPGETHWRSLKEMRDSQRS